MKSYVLMMLVFILLHPFVTVAETSEVKIHAYFEENVGQITDQDGFERQDILYLSRQGNLVIFFKANGFSYQLHDRGSIPDRPFSEGMDKASRIESIPTHRLDINWINSNPNATVIPTGVDDAYSNFYLSHCPDGILGVRRFQSILYKDIYPLIDLKFYHRNGLLKYDFIVHPGAEPSDIKIRVKGATDIKISETGEVNFSTSIGTLTEAHPQIYQSGRSIEGRWKLEDDTLSFTIDHYNKNETLIIDPLVYLNSIRTNAPDITFGSWAKVEHLTIGSTGLLYSVCNKRRPVSLSCWTYPTTYEYRIYDTNGVMQPGGAGAYGWAGSSAVDQQGNMYLAGLATLYLVATSGAYQQTLAGGNDAFLRKLGPFSTNWTTFFGGPDDEEGKCAIDVFGNPYIYGTTNSASGIATLNSYQSQFAGNTDGYLAKFNADGVRQWCTYFGGPLEENALTLTSYNEHLYLAGSTSSVVGIATPGSFKPSKAPNTGLSGFLACLDTAGSLNWATYYGDSSTIASCEIDTSGHIYLCGTTSDPTGIATPGVYQSTFMGETDGFVAKFDSAGNRIWGSYFGNSDSDWLTSLTLDRLGGNIFAVGSRGWSSYGIIAEFDPMGQLAWSTIINDTSHSNYTFLSSATFGNKLFVGGQARRNFKDQIDGYLYIFNHCRIPPPVVNASGPTAFCQGDSVILSINMSGNSVVRWLNQDTLVGIGPVLTVKTPGSYVAWLDSCANAISQPVEVRVSKPIISSVSTTEVPCTGAPVAEASANVIGGIEPYNYAWSGSTQNTSTVSNLDTGYYTLVVTDSIGCITAVDTFQIDQQQQLLVQGSTTPVPCTGVPYIGTIGISVSGGNPPYSYSWNNLTSVSDTLTALPGGSYTVTVQDQIGCSAMATFHIDSLTITEPSNPTVALCAVTVDSATGKNKVIWEKIGFVQAKHYKIFRQEASAQMLLLGVVARHNLSVFVDSSSIPEQQSYFYAISEIDSCGNESSISASHKTLHLSASLGLNGEINLNWNVYEGAEYQKHYVLRSINQGNYAIIAEVAKGVTSYSDLNPPPGNKRYRIEIDLPTNCLPTAKITSYYRISSNHVLLNALEPKIVPNPTNDNFRILGDLPGRIKVFDALGKLVLETDQTDKVTISHLHRGVYLVCLYDLGGVPYFKERLVKY